MRVRIEVHSALGKFILPQGYNPYVQGLINACIPENINWPREAGVKEAQFKLFTFSQLYARSVERIDLASKEHTAGESRFQYQLVFSSPVWFYLSSPSREFVESLARRLEAAQDLHLEKNAVKSVNVTAARVADLPQQGQVTWRVRTISPVTVYQSESRDSNSASYFAPDDPSFAKTVLNNAVRKYYAWAQEKAPVQGFTIKCLDRTPHLAVVNFKDTPVRGYIGRFLLTGDARFLSFLYESGLGGKNSHGFGMFDIIPQGEDARWERKKGLVQHDAGSNGNKGAAAGRTHRTEDAAGFGDGHREDRALRPADKNRWREKGDRSRSSRPSRETAPEFGDSRHKTGQTGPKPSKRQDYPHERKGTGRAEEPRHRFVSRYAPEIKPVSHAKAVSGSYSIWDGKTKTELPRFVRPDGTQSTGGPQVRGHRAPTREDAKNRPQSGPRKNDRTWTSSDSRMKTRYDMSKKQRGPHDQRNNRAK